MSQHKCIREDNEGQLVQVVLGYDRQLDGFCLTIFDGETEDPIFDNQVPYPKTLDPLILELNNRGITVSDAMLEELRQDQLLKIGNKVKRW